MKVYKCNECNYETNNKTKYSRHCKTKKHINNTQNITECQQTDNISPKTVNSLSTNTTENDLKKYCCEYCDFNTKYRQSYYRHLKKCKNKKEEESIDELKKLVELLNFKLKEKEKMIDSQEKKIDSQDKQIEKLIEKVGLNTTHQTIIQTQNNQTNQINQTIKLLGYKDTDYSHLTDDDYKQCISHINLSVPHLIKKIHFNKNKPENHNIYISNLKNKYIMLFDGEKWITRNQEYEIEDMLDNGNTMLEYKIEDWIKEGKQFPKIMKKFEKYMANFEKDEVVMMIKNEIKLLLYNNRSKPLITL